MLVYNVQKGMNVYMNREALGAKGQETTPFLQRSNLLPLHGLL